MSVIFQTCRPPQEEGRAAVDEGSRAGAGWLAADRDDTFLPAGHVAGIDLRVGNMVE